MASNNAGSETPGDDALPAQPEGAADTTADASQNMKRQKRRRTVFARKTKPAKKVKSATVVSNPLQPAQYQDQTCEQLDAPEPEGSQANGVPVHDGLALADPPEYPPVAGIDLANLPKMPEPAPGLGLLEYPFTHKEGLLEISSRIGKPALSLSELARSVMLSDVPTGFIWSVKEILAMVADTTMQYTIDAGERWEKTLKETLRNHYCFTAHAKTFGQKGAAEIMYSCDPGIDPTLRRQTGKRKQSTTPFSYIGSPTASRSPSVSTFRHVQSPSIWSFPDQHYLDGRAQGIDFQPNSAPLATGIQQTSLHFELDTSKVYEQIIKYRDNDVYYCMKCGPYTIWRRRRDSHFVIYPILRLLRLLIGKERHPAADHLYDLADAREVEDTLLKPTLSAKSTQLLAPLAAVRDTAIGTGLFPYLEPILDERLPELDDAEVLRLPALPATHFCHYCDSTFQTFSKLQRHQRQTRGTCQVGQPTRLAAYLRIFTSDLEDLQPAIVKAGRSSVPAATSGYGVLHGDDDASDTSSESDDDEQDTHGLLCPPSLTYWSGNEIELFHRSLGRRSRWRPDLIACDIGTKTEGDTRSLIEHMTERAALLEEDVVQHAADMPAAREMSSRWLEAEEAIAEDVVIWEAFTEEATRTPWRYRDTAQRAIDRDDTSYTHRKMQLSQMASAGASAGDQQMSTEWPPDLQPQDLPEDAYPGLKAGLQASSASTDTTSAGEVARSHALESLSWLQLTAIQPWVDGQTVEQKWDKIRAAAKAAAQPSQLGADQVIKTKLVRKTVFTRLSALGLDVLPSSQLETVYRIWSDQELSQSRQLTDDDIRDIVTSPAVSALARTLALEAAAAARPLPVVDRKALAWAEIPIRKATDSKIIDKEELDGIKDETQQAKEQIAALGINLHSLGDAGPLFDLRRLGALLDLYRYRSEDCASIAQGALQLFRDLLHAYLSQILALTANFIELRGGNEHLTAKQVKSIVEQAISTVEKQAQPRPSRAAFLKDLARRVMVAEPGGLLGSTGLADSAGHRQGSAVFNSLSHSGRLVDDNVLLDSSDGDEEYSSSSDDDETEDAEGRTQYHDVEKLEDERLEEEDRLEDLAYEDEMWTLLNDEYASVKEKSADFQSPSTTRSDGSDGERNDSDQDGDRHTGFSSSSRAASRSGDDDDEEMADKRTDGSPSGHTRGDGVQAADRMNLPDDDHGDCFSERVESDQEKGDVARRGLGARTAALGFRTKEFISLSDEEDL